MYPCTRLLTRSRIGNDSWKPRPRQSRSSSRYRDHQYCETDAIMKCSNGSQMHPRAVPKIAANGPPSHWISIPVTLTSSTVRFGSPSSIPKNLLGIVRLRESQAVFGVNRFLSFNRGKACRIMGPVSWLALDGMSKATSPGSGIGSPCTSHIFRTWCIVSQTPIHEPNMKSLSRFQ